MRIENFNSLDEIVDDSILLTLIKFNASSTFNLLCNWSIRMNKSQSESSN